MSAADGAWTPERVAGRIQHTLIATGTTRAEVVRHCEECLEHGFHAAMVAGNWLPVAREVLVGSGVRLASAVDFPVNQMTSAGKAAEARALVDAGAQELDMLVNIGWLRSGLDDAFRADIAGVVDAARPASVKVMLELPLLSPDERERAVALSVEAGVGYVKNASASAVGIASPEDMRYLRARVPATVGVKASGGIRTWEGAVALLDAGADLLGSSAGVAIIRRQDGVRSY